MGKCWNINRIQLQCIMLKLNYLSIFFKKPTVKCRKYCDANHEKYIPSFADFADFSVMAPFLFVLSFTLSFVPTGFSTDVMMTSSDRHDGFDDFAAFAKRFVKAVGSFLSFFAAARQETISVRNVFLMSLKPRS